MLWLPTPASVAHRSAAIVRVRAEAAIPHDSGWREKMTEEPILRQDPSDAENVRLYYGAVDGDGVAAIGYATARRDADLSDPAAWVDCPSNPIIAGQSRRLDCIVEYSGVLYLFSTNLIQNKIELFTSSATDGVTWVALGVVLTGDGQGRNDGNIVGQCAVLIDDGVAYMLYGYRNGADALTRIMYATAAPADLATWTKTGDALLIVGAAGEADTQYMEWKQIQKIGAIFVLTYEAWDGTTYRSHFASSTSVTSGWKKSPYKFQPSTIAGTFDELHVATAGSYLLDGQWWLPYQGTNTANPYVGLWSMGFARFTQGSTPLDFI